MQQLNRIEIISFTPNLIPNLDLSVPDCNNLVERINKHRSLFHNDQARLDAISCLQRIWTERQPLFMKLLQLGESQSNLSLFNYFRYVSMPLHPDNGRYLGWMGSEFVFTHAFATQIEKQASENESLLVKRQREESGPSSSKKTKGDDSPEIEEASSTEPIPPPIVEKPQAIVATPVPLFHSKFEIIGLCNLGSSLRLLTSGPLNAVFHLYQVSVDGLVVELGQFHPPKNHFTYRCFACSSKAFILSYDSNLIVLNENLEQLKARQSLESSITFIHPDSTDPTIFWIGCHDGKIIRFDIRDPVSSTQLYFKGHNSRILGIQDTIESIITHSTDRSVKIWDKSIAKAGPTIQLRGVSAKAALNLHTIDNGHRFAVQTSENQVSIYEVKTGELLAEFICEKPIKSMAWIPSTLWNQPAVLMVGMDRALEFRDASGNLLSTLSSQHTQEPKYLTNSGEDLVVVFKEGTQDNLVKISMEYGPPVPQDKAETVPSPTELPAAKMDLSFLMS